MTSALLIGINYIGTLNELRGCINDVVNARNLLKKSYGLTDKEIKVMTELAEDESKIPTRENILRAMDELVESAKSKGTTRLFFHYSGHGSYARDRNGDEIDGRDEMICPLDGIITDDEIRKRLIDPLPAGTRLFCIFDSCHSGTVCDLKYGLKTSLTNTTVTQTLYTDKKYSKTTAEVYLLSGCRDDQTSADAFEEESFQGALTYGVLKTLEKYRGRNPTCGQFMKTLCTFLKREGYSQVPQLSSGLSIKIDSAFSLL